MRTAEAYLEEARRCLWHAQRANGYVLPAHWDQMMWFRLLQWAALQGPQAPRK